MPRSTGYGSLMTQIKLELSSREMELCSYVRQQHMFIYIFRCKCDATLDVFNEIYIVSFTYLFVVKTAGTLPDYVSVRNARLSGNGIDFLNLLLYI